MANASFAYLFTLGIWFNLLMPERNHNENHNYIASLLSEMSWLLWDETKQTFTHLSSSFVPQLSPSLAQYAYGSDVFTDLLKWSKMASYTTL